MAILAGFERIKSGATYQGRNVDHVCIDTKGRRHVMAPSGLNIGSECLAVLTEGDNWLVENTMQTVSKSK